MSSSQLDEQIGLVAEFQEQLDAIEEALRSDPENAEYLQLKTEVQDLIRGHQDTITKLKTGGEAGPAAPDSEVSATEAVHEPEKPKLAKKEKPVPHVFKVDDVVNARWSKDNKFYKARINTVTGSSTAPQYYVTFLGYGDKVTLRAADVKPLFNATARAAVAEQRAALKRKADGSPVESHPNTPVSKSNPPPLPGVISADATVNPAFTSRSAKLPDKSKQPGDGGPKRTHREKIIRKNTELASGKAKWEDFQAKKSKGKFGRDNAKPSMFGLGESLSARVGFMGSGKPMSKDAKRVKYVHGQDQDNDDDDDYDYE